jgi:hypothetical protein
MLDFDWNQMRTSIPVTPRVTSGQVKVASPARKSNPKFRVNRYVRMVVSMAFCVTAASLLVSFGLHTFATSLSYKVQLAKLESVAQQERNARLQMSLDDLVTNQQSAVQLGLSEFSTPERIVIGGK